MRFVVVVVVLAAFIGSAAATDVAPSDARCLRELELQHRLEQQQLELQHEQRLRALERRQALTEDDFAQHRLSREREILRQERDLQARRFELDRQRLLQSMPRQPLQPRHAPGTLRLP